MARLLKSRMTIPFMPTISDGKFGCFNQAFTLPHYTVGLQYSRWGLIERNVRCRRYEATQSFSELPGSLYDFLRTGLLAEAQDAYAYFLYHKQLGR